MHAYLNVPELAFSIFTGDIVSHDPDDQQSQAYVAFEEEVSYKTFKQQLGDVVRTILGLFDLILTCYYKPVLHMQPWVIMILSHLDSIFQMRGTVEMPLQMLWPGITSFFHPCGRNQAGLTTAWLLMLPLTTVLMPQQPLKAFASSVSTPTSGTRLMP